MRGIRTKNRSVPRVVVCVDNTGNEASLELHKLYAVVPDPDAAADGDLRIVDESEEDYLYSSACFVSVEVPRAVERSCRRNS